MRFTTNKLANGLTLSFEQLAGLKTAAVGFVAKTGARDEAPDEEGPINGTSHFLEHMMFRGTTRRSWVEINRDFDRIGAQYNAFTGEEFTCYYAHVLTEQLPRVIELLADIMRPTIPEEAFHTEKKVILEEIAMYQDQPSWLVYDHALNVAFQGRSLGQSVLGTSETIGNLRRSQMLRYYRERYAPDNLVAFVTGTFELDQVAAELEKNCGAWAPFGVRRNLEPPRFTGGARFVKKEHLQHQTLALARPLPALASPAADACEILGLIFGDATGSRLFWKVKQQGLADSVGGGYLGFSDAGLLVAFASGEPRHAPQVASLIREEFCRLAGSIRADELERARTKAKTRAVHSGETPLHRFRQMLEVALGVRPYRTIDEELAALEATTLAEVDQLAAQMASAAEILVGIGPLEGL